jgi:hypothetical protein
MFWGDQATRSRGWFPQGKGGVVERRGPHAPTACSCRVSCPLLAPSYPFQGILATILIYVQYQLNAPHISMWYIPCARRADRRYSASMEHWHGFETARSIVQIHETTIADIGSDLSAHFVTVPARSLGGSSYRFQGSEGPLEMLGLLRIADVPFGGVARSLAACLVSDDVETFVRKFHQGFEEETSHSSVQLPEPFVFAEYLTFARVVPFEQPSLSADSLGNILTAQVHGEAGYMYHELTRTPVLAVSIPAGMVICGSAQGMIRTLESGLRQRLMELVKSRSGEYEDEDTIP